MKVDPWIYSDCSTLASSLRMAEHSRTTTSGRKIREECTLHLVSQSRNGMQIFETTLTVRAIPLNAEANVLKLSGCHPSRWHAGLLRTRKVYLRIDSD